MYTDGSEEISTDSLNRSDKQQTSLDRINEAKIGLKEMKEKSPNKLIVEHLNINSIRNKFEFLEDIINRNLDIILLSETKLDDSFPSAQFILKGYGVPYRFDRNSKGGGLLFYIREDIPSKFLKLRSGCNIESICVEINLRKRKWFINSSNNPLITNHLECPNRIIDEYRKKYQNFLFLGDFNVTTNEKYMEEFCNLNGLTSLIKKPACFKNVDKPTCIDLILTNQIVFNREMFSKPDFPLSLIDRY